MEQAVESVQMRWYRARTKIALGAALQSIRQRSGTSQSELASQVSSSRPHLSRLERGTSPQVDTLLRLLDVQGYELVMVPRGSTVTVEPPR
jgi:transcriptional regulator with XRE-family HTH domain